MSRGGKSFEIIDRKGLYSLEEIVGRNVDFQGDFGQGPERSEESCRECLYREYLHCHEQKDARNRNVNGASGESSEVRDMSLGIGGTMTLVIKWYRTWLNDILLLGRK